jgi:hypothetical protein
MADYENTVEGWLARYRAEYADPENLRQFIRAMADEPARRRTAQFIAAERYLEELARAEFDSQVSLAHAQSRPALDQAQQHHETSILWVRFSAWVAFLSALVGLASFLAGYFLPRPQDAVVEHRLTALEQQLSSAHPNPQPSTPLPQTTPPPSTPTPTSTPAASPTPSATPAPKATP